MNFDLTPEQTALITNADSQAALPSRALDAVLVVEERNRRQLRAGGALDLQPHGDVTRGRLFAAAAALGVGRAAVEHAVAFMKQQGVKPGPETAVPHWTVADGATDVEAARLLTYAAAQSLDRGDEAGALIARALEFASAAARAAVDAAIKLEGAAGFAEGGLLDRLARHARLLQVVLR